MAAVVRAGRAGLHATARRCSPSTPSPSSAASPPPSTTRPAARSWSRWCPRRACNNAVSLNSALMTGSRVFGPALAGLLVTTVGFGWCFLLDGVSYIAVLVGAVAHEPGRAAPRRPSRPKGKGQVREGLRYARSVPELWVPLVMMAVIGTLAFNFQTVLPLFTTRDLRRQRRHLHAAVLGRQRRLAARRAGHRPPRRRSTSRVRQSYAVVFGRRPGAARRSRPTCRSAFPLGVLRRPGEHHRS